MNNSDAHTHRHIVNKTAYMQLKSIEQNKKIKKKKQQKTNFNQEQNIE